MIRRVAVIPPLAKQDYLVNTVLDGLEVLQQSGVIDAFALADGYPVPSRLSPPVLEQPASHDFARTADAVLLLWGKKKPNWKLAEQLGCWAKTAFVDGSEPGGDLRFDARVQRAVLEGAKRTEGAVNFEMLRRCAAYFRREKPILPGMEALPFGIDRHHLAAYRPGTRKDIDFFCVFGQDKHPLLRREATAYLRGFCAREGFNCVTDKVAPDRFYELLARSKVGVSVGGGGYDTDGGRYGPESGRYGADLTVETVETPVVGSQRTHGDHAVGDGTGHGLRKSQAQALFSGVHVIPARRPSPGSRSWRGLRPGLRPELRPWQGNAGR